MNNPSSPSWGNKPLGKLISLIQNGTTIQQNIDRVGFPVSRIQTIQNNKIDPSKVRYINDQNKANQYRYKIGDILYSHINSFELVGKVAVYEGIPEFLVHGMNLLLIRVNENLCDPNYLYLFLQSPQARTETVPWIKRAIGQASINQTNLKKITVPLPFPDQPEKSIVFQRQIVVRIESLLSEVREMRGLQNTTKNDLQQLWEAILAETFPANVDNLPSGWLNIPVSKISRDTNRQNPLVTPSSYFNYVDIASVDNNECKVRFDSVKKILGKDAPSRARKVIHQNDVIIATTRPYLKNIAIIPLELDEAICSTGFCVLRAIEGSINPKYLYYAVQSNSFIKQLLPKQRGANYPAITDNDIFESQIPIPYPKNPTKSLQIQDQIASYLEAASSEIREMLQNHETSVDDIDELEKSIFSQAFRGEL